MFKGKLFVLFKNGEETIVVNQEGKRLLSTKYGVSFVNEEGVPFIQITLVNSDIDSSIEDHQEEVVKILYDLEGNEIARAGDFESFPSGGRIAFRAKNELYEDVLFDRKGESIIDEEKFEVHQVGLKVGEEVFHVLTSKEDYKYSFIDMDGKQVGPSFAYYKDNVQGCVDGSDEYVATIEIDEKWMLLRKDGTTEPFIFEAGNVYISKGIKRIEKNDDDGYRIVDENGENIFGPHIEGDYYLYDIKEVVAVGEKMLFCCTVMNPENTYQASALIDQDGKLVRKVELEKNGLAYRESEYLHIGSTKEKAFFEAAGDLGNKILDHEGNIVIEGRGVDLIFSQNGVPYFAVKGKDSMWVVKDEQGKEVSAATDYPLTTIVECGNERLFIWHRFGDKVVSKNAEPSSLIRAGSVQVLFDHNGEPYMLYDKKGGNEQCLVDCAEIGRNLFMGKFLGNVVSMQDRLLFLEQRVDVVIADTQGGIYADELSGILYFEKADDRHLFVVSQQGEELVKQVVEISFYDKNSGERVN